jgi:hypothetical protein
MKRLALAALVALAPVFPARAAEKPAAIQVCFELPAGIALYADAPKAGYAKGDDGYRLDFDLRLNENLAPERITRAGPSCLRAWLQAQPIRSIDVSFGRLAMNLKPASRAVSLKLRPDLWYDGGSVAVQQAPFSTLSTSLPGSLEALRFDPAGGAAPADPARLPEGRYQIRYTPPPPEKGSCAASVVADAVGTVRPDNKPAMIAELLAIYRKDYLPEVLARLQETCPPMVALEVQVRIQDGALRDPLHPPIARVRIPEREPRYALERGRERIAFNPGDALEIGCGQALSLVQVDAAAENAQVARGP